jgi:hypothetical protein
MQYQSTRKGIAPQDLAQDRTFWRDLLAWRERSRGLPAHSAGGYRNRRFAIIRNAAWITLYRARLPFPQVGVFLRCTGLAGEAFFTLADRARAEFEPRLLAEIGPGMGRLPPPWDDRHRGDPGRTAALGRSRGRTAERVDASGRRGVVELLRVVGGGFCCETA